MPLQLVVVLQNYFFASSIKQLTANSKGWRTETVILNFKGAQESIPRNQIHLPM
jgi:hypothetical protein